MFFKWMWKDQTDCTLSKILLLVTYFFCTSSTATHCPKKDNHIPMYHTPHSDYNNAVAVVTVEVM